MIELLVTKFDVENPASNLGAKFIVRDHGIGITDEDRVELFKPYFKTKDERSK